jgi:hypothetical protein
VTQNSERLADDEETDTQTVASCGIKPGEGLEDSFNSPSREHRAMLSLKQVLSRYSSARERACAT